MTTAGLVLDAFSRAAYFGQSRCQNACRSWIDPIKARRQRDAQQRMDREVRHAAIVRDDCFGLPTLGGQIDGDLGWMDRRPGRGPRQMQGRSRLIAGTASMGKSVDGEREAGGTDVKQWQAQMAYRAWRVEG